MSSWQQQGYLDRATWQSKLLSSNLVSVHDSFSEVYQHDAEPRLFEELNLDIAWWRPRLCKYFQIENLKEFKEVGWTKIRDFLDEFKNLTKQSALSSLLPQLKKLYVPLLKMKTKNDLPEVLIKMKDFFIKNREDDDNEKFESLIDQLESTVWHWNKESRSSYEFLVCVATLSLFGFNLEDLCFPTILKEKQIEVMCSMLSQNFKDLKGSCNIKQKQAFVLNIALCNRFGKTEVIKYILTKFPDTMCQELSISSFDDKNLTKLQKTVNDTINEKNDDKAFKNRHNFLSMDFQSIFSQKVPTTTIEEDTVQASNSFQSLLQAPGLKEYFPQKLTHVKVIKLTEEALKDANEKPSSLPELPWYFMRKMLGLNSTVRETGSAVDVKTKSEKEPEKSDDDTDSDWTDTSDEEFKDVEKRKENVDEEKRSKLPSILWILSMPFLCVLMIS